MRLTPQQADRLREALDTLRTAYVTRKIEPDNEAAWRVVSHRQGIRDAVHLVRKENCAADEAIHMWTPEEAERAAAKWLAEYDRPFHCECSGACSCER